MARYEDAAGNVIITIDMCDCGSTAGCDKCRPIRIPRGTMSIEGEMPWDNLIDCSSYKITQVKIETIKIVEVP